MKSHFLLGFLTILILFTFSETKTFAQSPTKEETMDWLRTKITKYSIASKISLLGNEIDEARYNQGFSFFTSTDDLSDYFNFSHPYGRDIGYGIKETNWYKINIRLDLIEKVVVKNDRIEFTMRYECVNFFGLYKTVVVPVDLLLEEDLVNRMQKAWDYLLKFYVPKKKDPSEKF
jgi:hypothetical protein